jgi:hypothetical protein
MAIKSGETTYHQAKRGIVQNGLVLNLDAGVDASYNGGTTWRDLEGGNNGTLTNGPTLDRDNGGSIIFDGSDDRVEIPDNDLFSFIGSAFSLSTWLKTSSTISSSKGFICKGNTLFAGEYAFHSYGSQIAFRLTDNSTGAYRGVATGGIDQGVWTNFVAVSDGTQEISGMSIYKNGVLLSVSNSSGGSFTGVQNTSTPLKVGARSNSEVFTGSIATSLIYNRALTATEVLQNYNVTRHRFGV